MPRTARSLGVLTAGAALLAVALWFVVRSLVGPDVPLVPTPVELGSPTTAPADAGAGSDASDQVDEVDGEAGPAGGAEAPRAAGGDTEAAAADRASEAEVLGEQHRRRGAVVVAPAPVALLPTADGDDREPPVTPVPAAPVTTDEEPVAAPPTTPPPPQPTAPPSSQPPATPPTPDEETTRRALTLDASGCAMPHQAGHGLGQARAHTEGTPASPPPRGQHERGCATPAPAERPQPADRPQPAATVPQPAAVRPQDDADGPGRGDAGGARRGRGPKG